MMVDDVRQRDDGRCGVLRSTSLSPIAIAKVDHTSGTRTEEQGNEMIRQT
jgi:hypothetical protein